MWFLIYLEKWRKIFTKCNRKVFSVHGYLRSVELCTKVEIEKEIGRMIKISKSPHCVAHVIVGDVIPFLFGHFIRIDVSYMRRESFFIPFAPSVVRSPQNNERVKEWWGHEHLHVFNVRWGQSYCSLLVEELENRFLCLSEQVIHFFVKFDKLNDYQNLIRKALVTRFNFIKPHGRNEWNDFGV